MSETMDFITKLLWHSFSTSTAKKETLCMSFKPCIGYHSWNCIVGNQCWCFYIANIANVAEREIDLFGGTELIALDILNKTEKTPGHWKKHRGLSSQVPHKLREIDVSIGTFLLVIA